VAMNKRKEETNCVFLASSRLCAFAFNTDAGAFAPLR